MCHQKLSIDLGPHVNFITGQNGSGKSAILAALQVGVAKTLLHFLKFRRAVHDGLGFRICVHV
jgi:recombinational DNA repair ATPase RecF